MSRTPLNSCYDGKPSNGDGPQTFEPTAEMVVKTKKRSRSYRKRRRYLIDRDGGKCYWCGCVCDQEYAKDRNHPRIPTIDHVVPLSRGGKSNRENLVLSCLRCNSDKGSMTAEEYRAFLASGDLEAKRARRRRMNRRNPYTGIGRGWPEDQLIVEWVHG